MKKAIIGLIVVLVLAAVLILLLRGDEDTWICSNGVWVQHGHPSASKPTKPCPVQSSQTKNIPTPTVNPNANIQLASPKSGATVSEPFVIKGQARVFENQLNYRVRDSKGQSLIEGTMLANAKDAGQFGQFEATINSIPKGKATIEVFDKSAKDGSEIDKVAVEVRVK